MQESQAVGGGLDVGVVRRVGPAAALAAVDVVRAVVAVAVATADLRAIEGLVDRVAAARAAQREGTKKEKGKQRQSSFHFREHGDAAREG